MDDFASLHGTGSPIKILRHKMEDRSEWAIIVFFVVIIAWGIASWIQ